MTQIKGMLFIHLYLFFMEKGFEGYILNAEENYSVSPLTKDKACHEFKINFQGKGVYRPEEF